MKVAVSGKGGVGKTLIAGGLAASLVKRGFKVLAIDADPSPNLALMLGLKASEAVKIKPISEDKDLIQRKTYTGYPGIYRLQFRVDDIVEEYAVDTPLGVSLLVMGTVKGAEGGCTCPANALLRVLMRHLVVERGEAVVMDMEAGVEHLGRGTAKHVDYMLIVSEPSYRSLSTALKIHELSKSLGIPNIQAVGNKVSGPGDEAAIRKFFSEAGIPLIGLIPFDEAVVEAERAGSTPLLLSNKSRAVASIEALAEKLVGKIEKTA
ncbi:MAG: cobyrinic acid a,c-diamide synthase [Thermoprotei archaeon]|nr:MAG: cobyrinic acid a,c-diamide synthase [Thermoprotei archaeon]